MLIDKQIKEAIELREIIISPFDPMLINPGSLDIRLGNKYTFTNPNFDAGHSDIDPTNPNSFNHLTFEAETHILKPHEYVLVSMLEHLTLPNWISAKVLGKSSLARLGLDSCNSAGFIDAGWAGVITLELVNQSNHRIKLTHGMKIGQLIFFDHEEVSNPYRIKGRYLNQSPGQGSLGV